MQPELAALHASSALTLVVRRAPPARLSQVFTSLQLAGARVLWLPAGSHAGALLEASPQDGGGQPADLMFAVVDGAFDRAGRMRDLMLLHGSSGLP